MRPGQHYTEAERYEFLAIKALTGDGDEDEDILFRYARDRELPVHMRAIDAHDRLMAIAQWHATMACADPSFTGLPDTTEEPT